MQEAPQENHSYLTDQLITYIGNKRALLDFIGQGVSFVQKKLNAKKLVTFDVFSGSGIVSRYLKQFSSFIYANDLEEYARVISNCYLANKNSLDMDKLQKLYETLNETCAQKIALYIDENSNALKTDSCPGFISKLYAPHTMSCIKKDERCFYTPYNAAYIDIARSAIAKIVPEELQCFFIAPLLAESSIHANTGGVFKGFYKNSRTGTGKFGGNGSDALSRITGNITLRFPVFSSFACDSKIYCSDANTLVSGKEAPTVDFAYIDPPYNQHPYGSNYFMLNLIANYKHPDSSQMSVVSGIPNDWNRSRYNCRPLAEDTFLDLVQQLKAKYFAVSFNNEGFISEKQMIKLLSSVGKVTVLEAPYTAFRASRNLSSRNIHVKEYLYIVQK